MHIRSALYIKVQVLKFSICFVNVGEVNMNLRRLSFLKVGFCASEKMSYVYIDTTFESVYGLPCR